ncbi:MAG TPA: hypothetical protein PL101_11850 [Bacteroidales bacterium]|nr:hypothetical protein [Bacteroidales bacterium]HQK71793.1 hypothetical protein [Bacteroidales bacterium]
MKKIIIIIIALTLLIIPELSGQVKEKFKYELTSSGRFVVSPVFEQENVTGKIGYVVIKDQKYAEELFSNVI